MDFREDPGVRWLDAGRQQFATGTAGVDRSQAARKRHPWTLERADAMARERGGRCTARDVSSSTDRSSWQCAQGHTFRMEIRVVAAGSWCPACARIVAEAERRERLDEMKSIARARGGQCLSKRYIDAVTLLIWKCGRGHLWEARPHNIKHNDTWCPTCAREARRGSGSRHAEPPRKERPASAGSSAAPSDGAVRCEVGRASPYPPILAVRFGPRAPRAMADLRTRKTG